uniref:Uncharacterized TPR repeat-containing protein At1g05150 n=1 Tax=Elaeis guineensis var. tenera TaxID=51953 RepID=A0A6I9QLR6_ELAGV|nr:uncharacterized TPR repeat-containing protein At1g05150 [Elaeis guineensis]
MATARGGGTPARGEKVQRIFERFDANGDGGLDRSEMAALVAAVNPSVHFTPAQIDAILDEVFRSYADFILDPAVGLSLAGLLRTYDDGAGDVDRDFAALSILDPATDPNPNPSPATDPDLAPDPHPRLAPAWVSSPNHGIAHESTWRVVEDLEFAIRSRIRASRSNIVAKDSILFDGFSDNGWSTDLSRELDRNGAFVRDDNSMEFRAFLKQLKEIRDRVDRTPTTEEAFDGHMAIGRTLYDWKLFPEALESFQRAVELRPSDVRPHFRIGNTLWSLGRPSEAKESYLIALESAEADSLRWSSLLPQIHVNLGIVMEGEGLLINASEHYREAAILCPTHYRALKLLGSALFGVGQYAPAEKALEEAVLLKPDYADAHCDLGSVLHAMGDDERAVLAFQKAIDLKPNHLDALYNLGGLFKDVGRYHRAAEMYGRVLAVRPDHWRAQLNRAVSMLGAGEAQEAKKALTEAFKMTKRVELYDAIVHLKHLQRKSQVDGLGWVVVDAAKFKLANEKTTDRKYVADALWIRVIQKTTKLGRCDVALWKKEMEGTEIPGSYAGNRVPQRSIQKAALEVFLRKLLSNLKVESFQGSVKAIDEKIWAVLDVAGSGRVDLGMFFAIIAPICAGPPEKRKRAAFDALMWCPNENEAQGQIAKVDASVYFRYLRVIYFGSQGFTDLIEVRGEEEENAKISFREFLAMFDDMDHGFGILNTLVKLEAGDRVHQSRYSCAVCQYRISGLMFKETTSRFCLCSSCYSECKVPSAYEKEEYKFKECQTE